MHKKLKDLKFKLKKFNQLHFSKISERVTEVSCRLESAQLEIFCNPNDIELVERVKSLQKELLDVRRAEESFYKKKIQSAMVEGG